MTYNKPLLLLFLGIALVGLWRMRRAKGNWLAACGVVGLLLTSWPPVEWLCSRPLEAWYPVRAWQTLPAPDAIVVLSSSIRPPWKERPFPLPDHDTVERCEWAAWLQRQWRTVPVLACGGPGKKGQAPYSATMRELLRRAGVPEDMIWTEERSHSTYENALYGAEVLRQHGIGRIALVVEARSMSRAAACFRKQGLLVSPAPCSMRRWSSWSEELLPSGQTIIANEITLHEMLGLAWYRVRGWI